MTTRRVSARPTAGVVVIGDEVLSGKVAEANIAMFVRRFRELGVALQRVAIITDTIADIAATVADFSARFDVVCTTGGIGPTHDDLTIEGVGQALDAPVETNARLHALIEKHVGGAEHMNEGYHRMALAPRGCELVGDPRWPTIKLRNVFVFPGVPALLVRKFEALATADHFAGAAIWLAEIEAATTESEVVSALNAVVGDHPGVQIGSYPQLHEGNSWTLRITAESTDRAAVALAVDSICAALGDRVMTTTAPRSSAEAAE